MALESGSAYNSQARMESARHWFSSGFAEPKAERERDRVCKAARNQKLAGRLNWLRRLHRSLLPERGPFSIYMHRSGAAKVSSHGGHCFRTARDDAL
jgi:hypothetical protein